MTYDELKSQLPPSRTRIQLQEDVKKFIGKNITINTKLVDISSNRVMIWDPSYSINSFSDSKTHVEFSPEKFRDKLLLFPKLSQVVITAKLISASFGYLGNHSYRFELIDIQKFQPPPPPNPVQQQPQKSSGQSGCFIATACYGNYDAPEVLVLRQFRDNKLLQSFFGRAFVKFYYSVSPFLAALVSKSDTLKKSVRQYFLDPIVRKLQQHVSDEK